MVAMKRIRYVSRFTRPLTAEEIDEISVEAEEHNARRQITGMMMASGGLFYQVIEGPSAAIDELFRNILHDFRHTDILVLDVEEDVEAREFPDWSMGTVNLDAESHVRLMPIKALVKAVFEQRRLIDNLVDSVERSIRHEMRQRTPG
jgi:hypothetical protein